MSDPRKILSPDQIDAAVPAGWHRVGETIRVEFATGDFATGLRLVNLIGASAEAADHHPDLTLTYPTVAVTLSSHDVGGVTGRDIDLARRVSGHAGEVGAGPA